MQLIEKCSSTVRIVVTGSGLVTLLNSFRTARVNGFALWDAVSYIGLGSAPPNATAVAMAECLLKAYSTVWPQSAHAKITASALVDALLPGANDGLTSARPALLAYLLDRMGDAATGSPEHVLNAAKGAAFGKIYAESVRDTLSALETMSNDERRVLHEVASSQYTCDELAAIQRGNCWVSFKNGCHVGVDPGKLAALISCLRETGAGSEVARLQPPYGLLLHSWVCPDGTLAARKHDGKIDLDFATRSNLVLIGEERKAVEDAGLWPAASKVFLASMLSNGIGFRDRKGVLRAPNSPQEFDNVPAFVALNNMLSAKFVQAAKLKEQENDIHMSKKKRLPPKPSLHSFLTSASVESEGGAVLESAAFQERLGMELILAFRHFNSHIWGDASTLVRNGMSAVVVAEAVRAVAQVLACPNGGCFLFDPVKPELMTTKKR